MTSHDDAQVDLVLAKLDRPPQDPLHAAVVLEAWAGQPSAKTLQDTEQMDASRIPMMGPSLRPVPVDNLIDIKEFTVLVTVLASVFLWLPALRDLLGADTVSTTMAWALPVALAIDRGLRVRYLATGHVQTINPAMWALNGVALAVLGTAWLISDAEQIGASLAIIWGYAGVLAIRKWPLAYINIVIAVASWLYFDGSVVVGLTVGAAAVLAATTAAVLTTSSEQRIPETFWITVAAAITGASAGVLLTSERDLWTDRSWWLGAAVLLVSLSGWWASARITQLWVELPSQLASVTIDDDRRQWGGLVVSSAVAGALSRVVLPTYVLLLALVVIGETGAAILVGAFAMFSVSMLLLGLVVATKHWFEASVASVLAAAVAVVMPGDVTGLPMLTGAAVAVLGYGAIAAVAFHNAPNAFATRMIIR